MAIAVFLAAGVRLPAYIPYRSENGAIYQRDPRAMPIQFRVNDQTGPNLSNITPDSDPMAAIEAAFQTWQAIDTAAIRFSPLRMTSQTSVRGDIPNLITFADTDANRDLVGAALAQTLVDCDYASYDPGAPCKENKITKSYTAFNPEYQFSTTLAAGTYDIQSICTHEIGHALGADHSGVLEATMYQAALRQQTLQRTLAPDDLAFAASAYPKTGVASHPGAISGSVKRNGAGVFGAHVVAFNENGTVVVGALTQPDGSYTVDGLPAGEYMVYAEPLDGPVQKFNLSGSFYSAIDSVFPSTFVGGYEHPTVFALDSGQRVDGVNLALGSASELLNIQLAGRTGGLLLPSNFNAYNSAIVAKPGERFNVILGGYGLNRVNSIAQIRIYGQGVTVRPDSALIHRNLSNGMPGIIFAVEVQAGALDGSRSILVSDGSSQALFTGGLAVIGASPSTTTTTLPANTTTTLPTTTTTTTTSTSSSTTSTNITLPTTTSSTSTTTTTSVIPTTTTTMALATTTSSTSATTTTTTFPATSTSSSTTSTTITLPPTTTSSSTTTSTTDPTTTSTSTSTTSTTTVAGSTTTTTLGPATMSYLHFPLLFNDAGMFTGLALANPSNRASGLTLTAYNNAGILLSGVGVRNPASLVLEPFSQKAVIADQVFRFPAGAPQRGWMEIASDNDQVTGFYLVGDYDLEFLDGADAGSEVSNELVLTGISCSTDGGTEISLVNPDPQRPARVTAELYNDRGHLLASLEPASINPMGRIYGSIPALFGITQLDMGHIEVHSDRGLSGALITGDVLRTDGGPATRLAILRAQPRTASSQPLYIPQFLAGSGFASRAILSNPSIMDADVRISFIGQDGLPVTSAINRTISAHASVVLDSSMFGAGGSPLGLQGYLRIEVSGGRVVGCAYIEDNEGTVLTGVNTMDQGGTESYLSQLATGVSGYYTGVACLNISSLPTELEIGLYNPSGLPLARGARTLDPGRRFSELVEQLTGFSSSQQGGYIRLVSTQPVACFGVVGTARALASVPAQIVRP